MFSLLSHCVILKSLGSYNISKAVPIFLLGLNELLEMQNACQISRQPDCQSAIAPLRFNRPIMGHVHIQIPVHRSGPRTRTSE